MKVKIIIHVTVVAALTACAADGLMVHSMLTRDGRRMVSRLEGGKRVYSLVPTNQLPANLPPVREWKLYGIKAAHTDIGLTNPQYIQRHWTVRRIDEAARLIHADKRADSDPAAYRYVMEGVWFWDNYHQDKGMDAAWRIVTNYMARGRMDVGVTCAGNHTHLYSATEIDRSTLTKRLLEQKWGIHTHTFFMADNPGKPPKGKTAIYPYLFTDWLQMHQPDGDSMNFTFRFAITSYAKGGRWANVARMCEDWLDPYAKWMREQNIPRFSRESVEEPPPGWTGLIEKPRAGHGEKDGQMYILWGAEMSPAFDHYELWRDGKFLANVTNEVPNGIPYRVARYEDLGLPTRSRHEYRIRKVWKDGRKDPLGEPFYGLTRYVHDATRDGVTCDHRRGVGQ